MGHEQNYSACPLVDTRRQNGRGGSIVQSSASLRAQYRELEDKYFQLRKAERYDQAQDVLNQLIEFVEGHPLVFDEVDDRVRILRARKLMTLYMMKRLQGPSLELADLLRQAADWSTPSICRDEKCAQGNPQLCISRTAQLSKRQAGMCINKLSYTCDALKIEASYATRKSGNPDLELVLSK